MLVGSIFLSGSALLLDSKSKYMHNTALERDINQVSQLNFTESLRMAQEISAQKQRTVYYSSLPKLKDWFGKKIYDLISHALGREDERLGGTGKQDLSVSMQGHGFSYRRVSRVT